MIVVLCMATIEQVAATQIVFDEEEVEEVAVFGELDERENESEFNSADCEIFDDLGEVLALSCKLEGFSYSVVVVVSVLR